RGRITPSAADSRRTPFGQENRGPGPPTQRGQTPPPPDPPPREGLAGPGLRAPGRPGQAYPIRLEKEIRGQRAGPADVATNVRPGRHEKAPIFCHLAARNFAFTTEPGPPVEREEAATDQQYSGPGLREADGMGSTVAPKPADLVVGDKPSIRS